MRVTSLEYIQFDGTCDIEKAVDSYIENKLENIRESIKTEMAKGNEGISNSFECDSNELQLLNHNAMWVMKYNKAVLYYSKLRKHLIEQLKSQSYLMNTGEIDISSLLSVELKLK